jgi:hypothetical protein
MTMTMTTTRIDSSDPFEGTGFEGPAYLGGDQSSRNVKVATLIEVPVFLSDDWDEEVPITVATLLDVEGGTPLLYDGESHSVSGPGGAGKSFLAQYAIAQVVATTRKVCVYVDYEGNRASFRERMKAMGITKAQSNRIAYWSVDSTLMNNTLPGMTWLEWVDEHSPGFIVIDSVSKACAAAGINDSNGPDYQRWDNGVIVPLTRRRITTLRIDHTGHTTGFGSAGNRERGASEKGQAVSGASYLYEAIDPWSRDSDGSARVRCLKDRHGGRKSGSVSALISVHVEDEGRKVEMSLTAVAPVLTNIDGSPRLSGLMEKISLIVERSDVPMSMSDLRTEVGGRNTTVAKTVELLIAEGYLSSADGARGSKLISSLAIYRQVDDTKSDKYVAEQPF